MTDPQPKKVCIIGGGASGVGLVWCLARAKQLGLTSDTWNITLLHDGPHVGGHSDTVEVTMDGQPVQIDLGVQMIAPSMYPAVSSMLALPEFADILLDTVELRLACAFPPVDGSTPYWGNFPAYQETDLYRSGSGDCSVFETLIQAKSIDHTPLEWVEEFGLVLENHRSEFADLDRFEQYFLDPYMSIMNGYGAALLDTVIVADVAPLWDLGLASMTQQTTGFGRFRDGAGSWVQKMADLAEAQLGTALDIRCGATVTRMQSATDQAGPTVTWTQQGAAETAASFDVVVSTVDMWTLSSLLSGDARWPFYERFIGTQTKYGTSVWDLQPGYCFLHQDRSVLAPGLQLDNQETLQFTASYSGVTGGGYDLSSTFTTYIESNLLGITLENPDDEWFLTMYGYDPTQVDGVPIPKDPYTHMQWEHGMWLPSFMVGPKLAFHGAQGISPYAKPYPGQQDTGIFFTGNNLTMDSEEGAFVSAMAIAKYAFGLDAPKLIESPTSAWVWAWAEFEVLHELMFPPHFLDTARRDMAGAEKLLSFLHPLRRGV